MTQQSITRILVIWSDFKGLQKLPDRHDNLICLAVLNHAAVHGNDSMALLLINTGDDIMSSVLTEYRMNLVAIMQRILHANDALRPTIRLHQLAKTGFLHPQLLLIFLINPLTATALIRHGTQL